MKNDNLPKNNHSVQGNPSADRANHNLKNDKKMNGITNAGGQRSDQTSNKDNQRKREKN